MVISDLNDAMAEIGAASTEFTEAMDRLAYELAYELAAEARRRRDVDRRWSVGERFAYGDREERIAYGTVTRVDGDMVWGRLDEYNLEDVLFHRLDASIGKA
jgi:hypothetical protein